MRTIPLSFAVLMIFVLGLSMVFNTSSAEILDRALPQSTHHALIKQIFHASVGIFLAILLWFYLGYEKILRLSIPSLNIGIILLIAVFIPGMGKQINGAHRWLAIGSFSFQPSELVKYLIPLYYIQVVTTAPTPIPIKNFFSLLLKLAIPIGLILIEPDNGTIVIILSSLVILFVLTKIRWSYWVFPLLLLFFIAAAIASKLSYVVNRIQTYLHPELDLRGIGHQPYQSKIAIGSGGVFGRGLGESLQKLDYLPEARSDYIAAIFGEEFGFFGIVFLILLFMLIGYFGFTIAAESTDIRAFYTAAIFTYLICIQAFLNLGVVSGVLPSKGANLPFFSQGGSSLLVNFIAVGIILNIGQKKSSYVR